MGFDTIIADEKDHHFLLHLLPIDAFFITLKWIYLKYSIHRPTMRQIPTIRNPDTLPRPAHQMMDILCPNQARISLVQNEATHQYYQRLPCQQQMQTPTPKAQLH
jgi:hypothetical protein